MKFQKMLANKVLLVLSTTFVISALYYMFLNGNSILFLTSGLGALTVLYINTALDLNMSYKVTCPLWTCLIGIILGSLLLTWSINNGSTPFAITGLLLEYGCSMIATIFGFWINFKKNNIGF